MPRYPNLLNPSSDIGQAFNTLGQALTSGPSPLERQRTIAARRQNESIEALARHYATYGEGSVAGEFIPHAMMQVIRAGYDPKDLANLHQFGSANINGYDDPRTLNAQVGAGTNFAATPTGVREQISAANARNAAGIAGTFDRLRYTLENTPQAVIGDDGQATYVSQPDAIGQSPVLSETERRGTILNRIDQSEAGIEGMGPVARALLNAQVNGVTPRNWVGAKGERGITLDGVTDAATGQRIPAGSAIYTSQAQGTAKELGIPTSNLGDSIDVIQGADAFDYLVGELDTLAQEDPSAFGITGRAQLATNAASALIGNLATMSGTTDLANTGREIAENLKSAGVTLSPEEETLLYNANVDRVSSLGIMIAYAGAAAIGQSGRDISDNDFRIIRQMVGDPLAWLGSADATRARLAEVKKYVNERRVQSRMLLGNGIDAVKSGPTTSRNTTEPGGDRIPQVGTIEDGYKFIGGDPSDPSNWEPVN